MVCPCPGSTPGLAIEVRMNYRQRIQDILPGDDALSVAASIGAEADEEIARLQRVISERDRIADRLGRKRRMAEEEAQRQRSAARTIRDDRLALLVKLREANAEIERLRTR